MEDDFLTILAVRGVGQQTIVGSLGHLITEHGRLKLADAEYNVDRLPESGREYAVAPAHNGWVAAIIPEPFETLAMSLSRLLGAPVLLFHYHNGDSWLYWLFQDGRVRDRFDSLPDYWGDASPAERQETAGRPDLLAAAAGVPADSLAPYLKREEVDLSDREDDFDAVDRAFELLDQDARVHPDDNFDVWDARVMFDFMRRLGITPPLGPNGALTDPVTILRFESAS